MTPPAPDRNELELEVSLRRIVLRNFAYRLGPLHAGADEGLGRFPGLGAAPAGVELELTARDTGLQISLRFERGEFVNVATAGLQMLDAADAAGSTEGR